MAAGFTWPPCHPSTCQYTTGSAVPALGAVTESAAGAGRVVMPVPEPPAMAVMITGVRTSMAAAERAASTLCARVVALRGGPGWSVGVMLPPSLSVPDSGAPPARAESPGKPPGRRDAAHVQSMPLSDCGYPSESGPVSWRIASHRRADGTPVRASVPVDQYRHPRPAWVKDAMGR